MGGRPPVVNDLHVATVEDARPTFGDRPRPKRQVLLTIVFGVLLVVVGVTATSQAIMVSVYASASTLNAIVQSDMATVRGFVSQGLSPEIVENRGLPPEQLAELERLLATILAKGEILQVELRLPDGRVVAASNAAVTGTQVTGGPGFQQALAEGQAQLALVDAPESEAAPGSSLASTSLLREYLPLTLNGEVVLVVALWRDALPITNALGDLRNNVVIVTITAAIIASIFLYLVFRSAQGRLARQSQALLEASLRDPLTGTLNHGTLVGRLATEIERARGDGTSLGVALIDLDGFRLLNDTHGHGAGDEALLAVVGQLETTFSDELLMGRYGPDEFLLVSATQDAEALRPVVQQFVDDLAKVELQFEATERLPITVSVGLATYPTHGASVTTLLSAAVTTLEDAKGSGGNAVRIASVDDEAADVDGASSFDVLKGLVIAVDTKDRYTKRHSEDVARYAVFIAERMGLDDETIQTIHVSGLLHDVGKIGIPDQVLRKPSRLTAQELDVIAQHVVLGEMIVRDLPDIDRVREGIKYHHERWDGRGYIEALRGEDIPQIGRILAVADTFSAMTTTRPYRKALDLKEALARLGDAAGSQLDEAIVKAFLDGLEQAADPPLPGTEVQSTRFWTPLRRAA